MNLAHPLLSSVLCRVIIAAVFLRIGQAIASGTVPGWAPYAILVAAAADVVLIWWLFETIKALFYVAPGPVPIPAPIPAATAAPASPADGGHGPAAPAAGAPAPGPSAVPVPAAATITFGPGKASWFGGPNDSGSGDAAEGLALVASASQLPGYFLASGPGLFRRLDPTKRYIACRWDYTKTPVAWLLSHTCTVTAEKTGKSCSDVQPVDWGPNARTGRIADLSPGLLSDLGIQTDDVVTVTFQVETTAARPASSASVTLAPQTWPLQSECPIFYGDPDAAGWEAANLVEVTCPWTLDMDGTKLHAIRIHRKCAASLGRVLDYVWEQCGKDPAQIAALHYDKFSGSFNNRNVAGSSTKSTHAYGAAIDFDDQDNQQHATRHLFTDDSLLIKAFKAENWIWGGDWSSGSIDPMHVQAARVR